MINKKLTSSLPKKYEWVKWEGRLPDMLATKVKLAFNGNRPVVEIKRTSGANRIFFRILQVNSFGTIRLITDLECYAPYDVKEPPEKRRRILEMIDDVTIVHEELCELMALSKAHLYGRKEVVA